MAEKDYRLTNIRAVSCIGVCFLHTFFACFSGFVTTDTELKISQIIRNLMYFAVPCFIMVTGALLFSPERRMTYGKVFKKYIPRMLMSLIIFSLLFKLIDVLLGVSEFSFKDLILSILTGRGQWAHMWYLYTMIALYLLIPALKPFLEKNSKERLIFTVILFLFLSVLPFVSDLVNINLGFYIPVQTIYPMYLALGICLYDKYFDDQSIFIFAFAGYIAGMTGFTIYYLNNSDDLIKSSVNNYSFPITVIGAVSVFMIIKGINKSSRILEIIDSNSFGIYLIHMIPLKIMVVKQFMNPYRIGIWFVAVEAASIFLISLALTAVLRKVPVIRKIL